MPHGNHRHGMLKHPIYNSWQHAKQRCQNPKNADFDRYGGRGIKVCARWQDFVNFRDDMLSSWQPGLEIDRIDNDGDYTPENCRWATRQEQNRNRNGYGKVPLRGIRATRSGRFSASIWSRGIYFHLGTLATAEEAEAMRRFSERQIRVYESL